MKILYFTIKLIVFTIIIFFASAFINLGFTNNDQKNIQISEPEFIHQKNKWVDSVFKSLTLEEKIAQLVMVQAYSNRGYEHKKEIENIIKKYKIGGLIFFQGGPVRQANLTNYYQSVSKVPLLIAMDAEWGVDMRLDSVPSFPRQMMMGAVQNDKLIYDFGVEIGKQCRRLGVHVNFAPVIDINNNPKNPVIGYRSFGEERVNVARKGLAYMYGMQEQHVIATAKHFPGHGDTDSDSHKTLPVIKHSIQRIDSLELYPFKYLINQGLTAVMIAHLNIPALDSTEHSASSLSKNVVTNLLKNQLGFKGLVFTDALGMKGVSAYNAPGETALKAFFAGVDILLMPRDVKASIQTIKTAVKKGLIPESEINARCMKVLKAKRLAGLDKYKPVNTKYRINDLNSKEAELINRRIIENALTLLQNRNDIIPFKHLDTLKIASVAIGNGGYSNFQARLNDYTQVAKFGIRKDASEQEFNILISKLATYNLVIVSFHKPSRRPPNFGLTGESIKFVHRLAQHTKVVPVIFSSPYTLQKFNKKEFEAILVSYQDTRITRDLSAQLLFGGIPAKGLLPVSAGKQFPVRTGIIDKKIRLKYAPPIELNIDELKLKKIDSIIIGAIQKRAMPGCQVLAIKNGVVFFQKSYGYHTYKKKIPVQNTDLYDIASLTKVVATVPVLMKLKDEGKFDVNKKMSFYLKDLDTTNKKNITVKQVLAHQARLKSWIPFYLHTYNEKTPAKYDLNPDIYSKKQTKEYNLQVADNLFIKSAFIDTIYKEIYNSDLRRRRGYKYSDLGYYLFYKIIPQITHTQYADYIYKSFYEPLGMNYTVYNPLRKFDKRQIVPTEQDKVFRKQLIHGFVHDYGAAMMGGVGAHAGIFTNANDLAKIFQMYLQKGNYGAKQYISSSTID
ncbi:MAG: serine hydrolase, partial [Bacteroidales bacterium]|nr:serine hydrolase [Bacteroidales bacterium]